MAMFFAVLCAVILWMPLPWGSNRAWSWGLLEVMIFSLLALWAATGFVRPSPRLDADARGFLVLATISLGYQFIYLLPVPGGLVSILAPTTAEIYRTVDLLDPDSNVSYYLSIDRHGTLTQMLKSGAYLALCYLVYKFLTGKKRLTTLLWLLLIMGVCQSAFGMFASFTGLKLVPDTLIDGHWNSVIGTFVNRNHFSAHLAMTLSAGLALLLPHLSSIHRSQGWRGLIVWQAEWISTFPGLIVLMMVIVLAGLFLSASRGAVAALFLALGLVLLLARLGRGPGTREMRFVPLTVLAVILAVAWMGATDFLQRILEVGAAPGERLQQWSVTAALIRENPLFGVGPGNYAVAFTAYRDGGLRPLNYDHAHNDYLELLAEQGVIGFLLLALAIGWVLFVLAKGVVKRRDRVLRGALFGSLVAMLTMLIHGLVDFNFQIPANAGYFYVWAGIGLAATHMTHDS